MVKDEHVGSCQFAVDEAALDHADHVLAHGKTDPPELGVARSTRAKQVIDQDLCITICSTVPRVRNRLLR